MHTSSTSFSPVIKFARTPNFDIQMNKPYKTKIKKESYGEKKIPAVAGTLEIIKRSCVPLLPIGKNSFSKSYLRDSLFHTFLHLYSLVIIFLHISFYICWVLKRIAKGNVLRRTKKIKQIAGPQISNKIFPSCWKENNFNGKIPLILWARTGITFLQGYASITGRLEATRISFTCNFRAEPTPDSFMIMAGLAAPKSSDFAGSRLLAARDFLPALRAGRSFVTRSQRQLHRSTSARSVKVRLACGMLLLAVAL